MTSRKCRHLQFFYPDTRPGLGVRVKRHITHELINEQYFQMFNMHDIIYSKQNKTKTNLTTFGNGKTTFELLLAAAALALDRRSNQLHYTHSIYHITTKPIPYS